jgi:hypothetical protein
MHPWVILAYDPNHVEPASHGGLASQGRLRHRLKRI